MNALEASRIQSRREPTTEELKTRLHYIARKSMRRSNALKQLHKAFDLRSMELDRIWRSLRYYQDLADQRGRMIQDMHEAEDRKALSSWWPF